MGGKVVLITDIDVCIAYREYGELINKGYHDNSSIWPHTLLACKFDLPIRTTMDACQRAITNGFVEYCRSPQYGCLTDKAYKLISEIEAKQKQKWED